MLTPQKDAPSGFPFSEKKARAHLGLSRDDMRALRRDRLIEGTHYARGKQASVWLNALALQLLSPDAPTTSERAATPIPHECTPEKTALLAILQARVEQLQKTAPPEIRMRVVNAQLKNKHILLACASDDDPLRPRRTFRVRVNSSVNFVRAMEIPVQPVIGYTDLFELTRKCPRQKGKW